MRVLPISSELAMPVGAMRLQKTFQVSVTRGRPEKKEKMTRNKPESRNLIVKWKRVTEGTK